MTTTKAMAKVAAVASGLAMVTSMLSLAPFAHAQTTTTSTTSATTTTTTSACSVGSMDLTVGSTGAAVVCLQNALVAGGYLVMPAGVAPGYFGALTKAAVIKWQMAAGVSPAAGYFGPISRAKFNLTAGGSTGTVSTVPGCMPGAMFSATTGAACTTTSTVPGCTAGAAFSSTTGAACGTGTTSTSTGPLKGGEADLTEFNLRSEDASGDEGEEGVDLATAEFDVEDADIRIERVELTASSSDLSLEDAPWQYFDTIGVYADGKKLAEIDASDRDEWDEGDDGVYTATFTGLSYVVRENATAKITFTADLSNSIDDADLDQEFDFYVDTDGIRGVDAAGVQQYTGDEDETVTFSFGEEDNGDLTIKSNSDDPNASILVGDADDESDDLDVFVFDIDNDSDADAIINDLTIGVTTGTNTSAENIIRTATLTVGTEEFDGDIASTTISFDDMDLAIDGDDSVTATLTVTLKASPVQTTVIFDLVGSTDVDAEGAVSGDDTTVGGSQTSSTHTVALTGIVVKAVSHTQSVTTPGSSSSATYGSYTLVYTVQALEEDAFIDDTAASSTALTYGAGFSLIGDTYAGPAASAVLTSTADLDSGTRFVVREGDTETFTLTVTLNPTTAGTFGVRLNKVNFNDDNATADTSLTVDPNENNFRTATQYIAN